GLLLPAVQKVREAASRLSCTNNLKQIGLALHGYEHQFGSCPPGYVNRGGDIAPTPGWGWPIFLLPYLEQGPLVRALGAQQSVLGNGPNPAPPTALTQTSLPIFRCPSDLGTPTNPFYDHHGTSNYRGVSGSGDLYGTPMKTDFGGLFYANSHVRFLDVTDG